MTTDRETGVGIGNTGGTAFKQSDLVAQDGWVYAPDNVGTPSVPVTGDWRTQIQPHPTITDLTVTAKQRFNVVWTTQVEDGKASVNSAGFEINRGSEGFSYGNDTTPSQTLVNIAPGINGATIGSTVGDTAVIAENGPFALHTDPTTFSEATQPDGTETLALPFDSATQSFLHVFQITESLTTIEKGVSVFVDAASDITGATIRAGNLLPDGADAIQSVSFDAFQAGDAQAAVIGQNDLTWEREYPVQQGVVHFGFIQSNKPLIIQGKTIATVFVPKFNREIHEVDLQVLLNLPTWEEKTFAVDDWIIEGADTFPTTARVYVCNTAGPQTASFAANLAKWDKLTAGGGGGGGDLLAANNLSDVDSASTSRTNLDVDQAGTDNSTNVSLGGVANDTTDDTLDLAGQTLTVNLATPTTAGAMSATDKVKLGSLTGGRFLGVFADLAALQTAHPTGVDGDSATVTSPDGNLFYWDGAAWADSGTGFIGDMLKAIFDPTAKNADAFSMGNMVETASEKVLTSAERAAITANTAKVSNANHTGEVTGSGALTAHPTIISNKALVTALSGMTVLVVESGVLKKVDAADFLGGAQPGLVQTDFQEVTVDVSTTSATFVTLLTSNITTGANDLIIEVSASLHKTGGGVPAANLRITIDGTPVRGTGVELTANSNSASLQVKKAVTAAAHVILLEWKVDTGTAQIQPVSMPDSEHCSLFVQEVRV